MSSSAASLHIQCMTNFENHAPQKTAGSSATSKQAELQHTCAASRHVSEPGQQGDACERGCSASYPSAGRACCEVVPQPVAKPNVMNICSPRCTCGTADKRLQAQICCKSTAGLRQDLERAAKTVRHQGGRCCRPLRSHSPRSK